MAMSIQTSSIDNEMKRRIVILKKTCVMVEENENV